MPSLSDNIGRSTKRVDASETETRRAAANSAATMMNLLDILDHATRIVETSCSASMLNHAAVMDMDISV
jgi:hypothetical protein